MGEDASAEYAVPVRCLSFRLTGRHAQLGGQSAALGDSCGHASPLGISGGTLLQVKYLKLLSGRQPLAPLCWGGRSAHFPAGSGRRFSHCPHSSLQTENRLGSQYRDIW